MAGSSKRARERGFTIVEMLVVLALIALVLGLVGPRAVDWLSSGETKAARAQIRLIEAALDLYRLEVGRFPSETEGLEALVARPSGLDAWNGPYLGAAVVPPDPWGKPYQYRAPGREGRAYDLFSFGADGRAGGEGDAADIGGP